MFVDILIVFIGVFYVEVIFYVYFNWFFIIFFGYLKVKKFLGC